MRVAALGVDVRQAAGSVTTTSIAGSVTTTSMAGSVSLSVLVRESVSLKLRPGRILRGLGYLAGSLKKSQVVGTLPETVRP